LRYPFDLLWRLHGHVMDLLLPASWSNPFWTSPQTKFQLFEDGYLDFNLRSFAQDTNSISQCKFDNH
jgi:hypothetical protein